MRSQLATAMRRLVPLSLVAVAAAVVAVNAPLAASAAGATEPRAAEMAAVIRFSPCGASPYRASPCDVAPWAALAVMGSGMPALAGMVVADLAVSASASVVQASAPTASPQRSMQRSAELR